MLSVNLSPLMEGRAILRTVSGASLASSTDGPDSCPDPDQTVDWCGSGPVKNTDKRRTISWHGPGLAAKRRARKMCSPGPLGLVAGAGFEPATFGL